MNIKYVDKKILSLEKNTIRSFSTEMKYGQMATSTIIFKVLEMNLQQYVSQSC